MDDGAVSGDHGQRSDSGSPAPDPQGRIWSLVHKSLVSAIIAASSTVLTAIADDSITRPEWVTIVATTLLAGLGVGYIKKPVEQ